MKFTNFRRCTRLKNRARFWSPSLAPSVGVGKPFIIIIIFIIGDLIPFKQGFSLAKSRTTTNTLMGKEQLKKLICLPLHYCWHQSFWNYYWNLFPTIKWNHRRNQQNSLQISTIFYNIKQKKKVLNLPLDLVKP